VQFDLTSESLIHEIDDPSRSTRAIDPVGKLCPIGRTLTPAASGDTLSGPRFDKTKPILRVGHCREAVTPGAPGRLSESEAMFAVKILERSRDARRIAAWFKSPGARVTLFAKDGGVVPALSAVRQDFTAEMTQDFTPLSVTRG
jgi:hypothetical protein